MLMFTMMSNSLRLNLCLLLLGSTGWAQITAIEGNVKGPDGKMVRGAEILIEREDMRGIYKGARTDKNGHYIYNGLPIGSYTVSVLIGGEKRDSQSSVRTRLGDPIVVDFDLGAAKRNSSSSALGPIYVNSQNSADRLQLNRDGSFSLQEGGRSFSGTYSVREPTLTLHIIELQKDVDIAIQGDRLIVNGDEVWVQPNH